MGRQVRLGDDQAEAEDQQGDAGGRNGQLRAGVEAEEQGHGAEGAGDDRPGHEELDPDADHSRDQQQIGDAGVDDDLEQLVGQGQVVVLDGEPRRVERLRLGALHVEAVELREEVLLGRRDDVDQAGALGLGRGDVGRLANELLGEPWIAAVDRGQGAHRGRGIVDDLAVEVGRAARRRDGDGRRRADVGLGRHGRHVGGLGYVGAGRRGAGAVGRDVDHHR